MLVVIFVMVLSPVNAFAEANLTLKADQTEIVPGGEIKISIEMSDENLNFLSGERTVLVKLSRGGLSEPEILRKGLILKDGKGEFTYLAPGNTGTVDILVIDLTTNLSAKLSLQIVDEPIDVEWKKEYAVITNVKGKVAVQSAIGEIWDSALVEHILQEGDSIRTWEDSWATIQLFDGTEIVLQPWTTLYIKFLKSAVVNSEVKQSVLKVAAGKVLCKVKEYLEKGSKFEIETESSTAGIRGTYFEVITTIQGGVELIVFDGEVILEHRETELVFPVLAGQKLTIPAGIFVMPELIQHHITPDERDQILEEEKTNAEETESINAKTDNIQDQTGRTYDWKRYLPQKTNLHFGSQAVNNSQYMTLEIQPEFHNILDSGLSCGVNLAFYQDFDGKVRFGSPDDEVMLGNIFNWIEYAGKYVYGRYDYLNNITYGYGLLMGGYQKPEARGFQLGLNNITSSRLGTRVLLPFDIKSIYPWRLEETSSLYAGRLTTDFNLLFIPLRAGISVVTEQNPDLINLEYPVPMVGVGSDLSIQLISLVEPYVEVANLLDFGVGAELGVRGQVLSMIWYQAGLQVMTDNFVPNYFGNSYEEYKRNSLNYLSSGEVQGRMLPDLLSNDFSATQGFYTKAGINLGEYGMISVGFEDYVNLQKIAPIVSAECMLKTPGFSIIPQITSGFKYRQTQFNNPDHEADRWLNENTQFSWYIKYPLVPGMMITLENRFKPANEEIMYQQELGVQVEF